MKDKYLYVFMQLVQQEHNGSYIVVTQMISMMWEGRQLRLNIPI